MRRLLFAVAFLPFLALYAVSADEPRVEVTVSNPRPAANEVVVLSYTFRGTSGGLKAPAQLPLKNLVVVGGPSTSTRVTMINFETSSSTTVSYYLRPQGQGQAEVGETTWSAGDRSMKAASYLLEVGPTRQGMNAGPGPGIREDEPDPFPFPGRRSVDFGRPMPQREALVKFIVTPDKTTAYVGEEITLHYELLTQADISALEFVDPPKFAGLWAEDLEKPEKPQGHPGTYENRQVTRFTLLKKVVSGLAAGTVTIPASTVRLSVRLGGDPFSDPFGWMRPQVVDRSTDPITLKFLPIPGVKDFKGPVGHFDISAKLDRNRVAAGEAVTLKVRVAGTGNLRQVTEPPKIAVPNARLYPPTTKAETSRLAAKGNVYTEWSYVIVPSVKGELTIPPVTVDVFDPAVKKVVAKATEPLAIFVEGAAATAPEPPTSVASASPGSPGEAQTDVQPVLKSSTSTLAPGSTGGQQLDLTNRSVSVPLWVLALIPGVLLLGVGFVVAARSRVHLRSELAEALRPEPDEMKERAAARIDRALRDGLARRYKIADTASSSALLEALSTAGAPTPFLADVKSLLEKLDFLRFAPQLGEYSAALDEVRQEARKIFRKLK